jgi:hypothetical protein
VGWICSSRRWETWWPAFDSQATVNSLASVRQTEKTTRELNDLARSLLEVVGQYQL